MIEIREEADSLEVRLTPSLEGIDLAVAEAERFLSRAVCDAGALFCVLVGLREALLNAALHGCRRDPALSVLCRLALRERRLSVLVADPGPGFDWRGLAAGFPDARREGGRGIPILRSFFGDLHYNERGNRLEFSKRLP